MGAALQRMATWDSAWVAWTASVGLAVCIIAVTVAARARSRRRPRFPDVSVPEALRTLTHGPRELKVAAAAALCEVLNGEVPILEEITDEVQGKHVSLPKDGRHLFVRLVDLLATENFAGAESIAEFLCQCTGYDEQWDPTDEWNEFTEVALGQLKAIDRLESRLSKGVKLQGGDCAIKLNILLSRLAGSRCPTGPEVHLSAVGDNPPGMLSMNTRVKCAECLAMQDPERWVICEICNDTGYCSVAHRDKDIERHKHWCFPVS